MWWPPAGRARGSTMSSNQFPSGQRSSVLPNDSGNERRVVSKATKVQYILTGFTHELGFRVFAFELIGEDRVRTSYSVRADLALTKRYGIQVQELPLLCRSILEQRDGNDTQRAFTYTEDAMCLRANTRAEEAAAQKRKPPRGAPIKNSGAAWRHPHW